MISATHANAALIQQGGNALSEAIATIAGGAVVIAAGVFFGQLQW